MQVPVFLTRHVFVKVVPAGTISLSAIVTSATKAALLVQSGELVGRGVSGVGVALASTDGVSVAVGLSVAVATRVSVTVGATGVAVSVGDCLPQAEVINTRKRKTTSNFSLIKASLLFSNGAGRQFHYIHKSDKKTFFQENESCNLSAQGEFSFMKFYRDPLA
jgi:hypothetical protein